jgi:hypothetical protein
MKVKVLQKNYELFLSSLYWCSKNKNVSNHIIFYFVLLWLCKVIVLCIESCGGNETTLNVTIFMLCKKHVVSQTVDIEIEEGNLRCKMWHTPNYSY